jgi:predicted permease
MWHRLLSRLFLQLRRGRARLGLRFQRRDLEAELSDELQFHLDMQTQENVRAGLAPEGARRAALRAIGGVDRHTEAVRDQRATVLDPVVQDLRYSIRRFRNEPGFVAIAVMTIGLAVGLATAIYSVAASVLLRPFPYRDPNRLVTIWRTLPALDFVPLPIPEFIDIKGQIGAFDDLAGFDRERFDLIAPGIAEYTDVLGVTTNLFSLLGVQPILGRTFRLDENQPGRERVVVLAEDTWRRVFGGDPGVVGRRVRLVERGADARVPGSYEVIGVVSSSVRLSYRLPLRADLYVPLVISAKDLTEQARGAPTLLTVGRLTPGLAVGEADAQVRTLIATLAREHPAIKVFRGGARVTRLHEELVGQTRPAFLLLATAAAIVLLIGCANIANLLLASGLRRGQEISVRLSIGCSRRRLMQQLLTEHLLLAVLGGALGVLLAQWMTPLLARLAPDSLPRVEQIRIDLGGLGFAVGVSLLAGLVFGTVPAWVVARPGLTGELGTRGGGPASGSRLRGALVVAETALVLLLLTGAGLLVNGLWRLAHLDLGFNPDHVLKVEVMVPNRWASRERAVLLEGQLLEAVRALPGVRQAAASSDLPFAPVGALGFVGFRGSDKQLPTLVTAADTQYLSLMQVPLREGRMLDREDVGNRGVVVVNESLARQIQGRTAIGQRVRLDDEWRAVVGVVGDITEVGQIRGSVLRWRGLQRLTLPAAYVPSGTYVDAPFRYLLVRSSLEPTELAKAVRAQIRAVDPEVTVGHVGTMEERVARVGEDTRFYGLVVGTFAVVAVMLAAIGLYGVLAYTVSQRTREIGIRMALGASPARVRWLVAGRGLGLVALGAAIGTALAVAGGRLIQGFLFEVRPTDPLTLGGVVILLWLVAALATVVPVRRATRVDPQAALRCE